MSTEISWTDETWNPVTGCTRVSPGCDNCYIARTPPMRMAGRKFDGEGPGSSTGVLLHPDRLERPLRWSKPRRVFVNSMSDLFHDDVPDEFIARVWAVMALAPQHTFQILTKRPGRMRSLLSSVEFEESVCWAASELIAGMRLSDAAEERLLAGWMVNVVDFEKDRWEPPRWPLPNVWLGVSVEDQKRADLRIPALLATPAAVRFLSCEPLLGPVSLRWAKWVPWVNGNELDGAEGLDWVIVGGESGPGARPMHPDWARSLRDQCQGAGVAFHLKQWGEWSPHPGSKPDPDGAVLLDGRLVLAGDETWMAEALTAAPVARVGKKAAGRVLDGRTWDEFPEVGQP